MIRGHALVQNLRRGHSELASKPVISIYSWRGIRDEVRSESLDPRQDVVAGYKLVWGHHGFVLVEFVDHELHIAKRGWHLLHNVVERLGGSSPARRATTSGPMTSSMQPDQDQPSRQAKPVEQRRREIGLCLAVFGVLGAAAVGVLITRVPSNEPAVVEASAASTTIQDFKVEFILADLPDLAIPDPTQNAAEPSTEVEQERADGQCTIGAHSLRLGASGDGVRCLQHALKAAGDFTGEVNGVFDDPTVRAVMAYQTAEKLFVDGVVGRESSISLDIWHDEESFVVRTPPPPAGATDLWGVALSPVASAADDAPTLPANSGSGRRIVYDRAGQRVWAVRDDGVIIRSWLVSGSTYSNEVPGKHQVYSRSDMSTAWNGKAWLPQMVRWYKTDIGALGFHSIPLSVKDNSPYQTTDELGTRLSGGCQRQHTLDAEFMWAFAAVGTPVIVT